MTFPNFKVCVRCFTFNQADYIRDTLNGFVIQHTDFPFICCIVDDASVDGEQKVIRNFVEEFFDSSKESGHYTEETDYANIIYAQHKTNKNCYFAVYFLKYNHRSIKKSDCKLAYLSQFRSNVEYEAMCEGDDYWIAPDKLQQQVRLLDSQPDCAMCYTRAKVFSQSTNSYSDIYGNERCSFEELLVSNSVPALTTVYRIRCQREYSDVIKPENKGWMMGDYPMWLYFSAQYNIQFIDSISSVYRLLVESASHSQSPKRRKDFILSTKDISCYFADRYSAPSSIRTRIVEIMYERLADECANNAELLKAIQYSLMIHGVRGFKMLVKSIRTIIRNTL